MSRIVVDYIGTTTALDRQPQLQKLYDSFKAIRAQFETEYNNRETRNVSSPSPKANNDVDLDSSA